MIAIRTEFIKLWTTKLWWLLLLCLLVYTFSVVALLGAALSVSTTTPIDISSANGVLLLYNVVPGLGFAAPLLLGGLMSTSEYSTGIIYSTFVTQPRRIPVILAKAIVAFVVGCIYGVAGSVGSVAIAASIFTAGGKNTYLDDENIWIKLACGVLAMGLWAVIGVGFGALVRNQIVTVVVLIGFSQMVEPVLRVALGSNESAARVTQYLPAAVSDAFSGGSLISAASSQPGLPPVTAGVLFLGYGACLVVAGSLVSRFRDVT